MTYEIFESLKEAYEKSIQNNNYFLPMLNRYPIEKQIRGRRLIHRVLEAP